MNLTKNSEGYTLYLTEQEALELFGNKPSVASIYMNIAYTKDIASEWIDDYRRLFLNVRTGAVSTKVLCLERMNVLLTQYGYNKKEVIDGTKYYLNRMKEEGRLAYVMNADNFIYRATPDESMLSQMIEEKQLNQDDTTDNSTWIN